MWIITLMKLSLLLGKPLSTDSANQLLKHGIADAIYVAANLNT